MNTPVKPPTNQVLARIALATVLVLAGLFAGYLVLRSPRAKSPAVSDAKIIGEIKVVNGNVDHRLPRSVQQKELTSPKPLYDQEIIITRGQSDVTLTFKGGASIKLEENSRLVAERDSTRPDSIIATVIEGGFQVLQPGNPGAIRIFKDGFEQNLRENQKNLVPVIRIGPRGAQPTSPLNPGPATSSLPAGSAPTSSAVPESVIAASTPDETLDTQATLPRTLPPKRSSLTSGSDSGGGSTTDTLTNEEIARQLRSQTGFFQRCYLTYINRIKDNSKPASGGTVTVGFTIQPNGKPSGVKLVRSDFQDQTLLKCVNDVVTRTSFKPFNAEPIPVLEFPITLQ